MSKRSKYSIAAALVTVFVTTAARAETNLVAGNVAVAEELFLADVDMSREDRDVEGAKKKSAAKEAAKKAAKHAAKAAAKAVPMINSADKFAKAADGAAKLGWALGNIESGGLAGPYPGFKDAVVAPIVAKAKR